LGHPLHAVLTDVVVGAWVLGGAFDAVGELRDSDFARRAGDALTGIGVAAAIPTALTGITDFTTVPARAARAGTLHGLLNAVNLGLYALSLRERKRGNRGRGMAYSGVALGLATVSAWLGGHLVYEHRVGVDHADRFDGPADWTPVMREEDLHGLEPARVEVGGKRILLYREGNDIYAVGAVCSHAGGPLERGAFSDTCVRCPWHDSVFDLADGGVLHGPATRPLAVFDTRIREDWIEIRHSDA